MIGVEFDTPEHAEEVQWACFVRGLLVLECGRSSVRMSPAADRQRGRDGDRPADLRRGRRGRRRRARRGPARRPSAPARSPASKPRSDPRPPGVPTLSRAIRRPEPPRQRPRSESTTSRIAIVASPTRMAMPMIGLPIRLSSGDPAISPSRKTISPTFIAQIDDLVGPRPAVGAGRRPGARARPKIRLVITPMNAAWSLATRTPVGIFEGSPVEMNRNTTYRKIAVATTTKTAAVAQVPLRAAGPPVDPDGGRQDRGPRTRRPPRARPAGRSRRPPGPRSCRGRAGPAPGAARRRTAPPIWTSPLRERPRRPSRRHSRRPIATRMR